MKVSLKALRVNSELTQNEVAEKLGVRRETVMSWESYKTSPDVSTVLKLCKIYNCTLDDIFLPDQLAKSE